jgi:hypothetical protein
MTVVIYDGPDGPIKVRKRPLVVEAYRYTGANAAGIVAWAGPSAYVELDGRLIIRTDEGDHEAYPDDVVMRGVEGELYPIRPSIYAATYDEVAS